MEGPRLSLESTRVLRRRNLVALGTTVIASIVLTDPQTQTLAVGLYQFVSQETSSNWTLFSAGAVLAAIPVMALFLYLQKYIIGGLTAGSVK